MSRTCNFLRIHCNSFYHGKSVIVDRYLLTYGTEFNERWLKKKKKKGKKKEKPFVLVCCRGDAYTRHECMLPAVYVLCSSATEMIRFREENLQCENTRMHFRILNDDVGDGDCSDKVFKDEFRLTLHVFVEFSILTSYFDIT